MNAILFYFSVLPPQGVSPFQLSSLRSEIVPSRNCKDSCHLLLSYASASHVYIDTVHPVACRAVHFDQVPVALGQRAGVDDVVTRLIWVATLTRRGVPEAHLVHHGAEAAMSGSEAV